MRIAVPHHRQIADGFCLPACAEMVLASLGIKRSQADIARALGTLPNVGTRISNITQLPSRIRELRAIQVAFYEEGEPQDLEQALREGISPILRILTGQLPYWSENTFFSRQ